MRYNPELQGFWFWKGIVLLMFYFKSLLNSLDIQKQFITVILNWIPPSSPFSLVERPRLPQCDSWCVPAECVQGLQQHEAIVSSAITTVPLTDLEESTMKRELKEEKLTGCPHTAHRTAAIKPSAPDSELWCFPPLAWISLLPVYSNWTHVEDNVEI